MKAGRFRHWVTFQDLWVDQDSDGAIVEEWIPAFEVNTRMPCEVVTLTGRELIAAQATHSKVTTRITARYRHGFKPRMRAVLGDVIYNIEAVIPDPVSGRQFVTLLCSSGVNDG